MSYRITGLDPAPFHPLFVLDDAALRARGAERVVARGPGAPCRVSLTDSEAGERLILANFVSNPASGPYRSGFAIFVSEAAQEAALYQDEVPALLDRRALGLRGYDSDGRLVDALLALPGTADAMIRGLLENREIAQVHAHNAAHGCYLARIERTN